VQSFSQITTTSIPTLRLQAGCPSCHPTNRVKALKASDTHTQKKNKNNDEQV